MGTRRLEDGMNEHDKGSAAHATHSRVDRTSWMVVLGTSRNSAS